MSRYVSSTSAHLDTANTLQLEGNDIWGWTSKTGREFGVVGQVDGTAFVEVLKDGTLKYLGRLGPQTVDSIWRDIKVLGDYAYIGSEAEDHGLQIFDLKKLLTLKPNAKPTIFSTTTDISHFAGFGSSHNLVISESSQTIIAVGSKLCNGGLFFVDVRDPLNPKDAGCAAEDGYVHDAQCTIYKGPDRAHQGKEICFGFNEDTLTIYDITTKSAPTIISRTPYAGAAYSHQGWLANDEQTYLLLDDELDEVENTAPGGNNRTTTYVWDIKKLSAPINTGLYKGQAKSIDHNQYVIKGLTYQANYGSGLRIVDISSVAKKPDGSNFKEVGFFDCYPEDDEDKEADTNQFYGTWSVYPFFKSQYLLLNSIERGVFALKYTGKK